jgi:hypothetical protein
MGILAADPFSLAAVSYQADTPAGASSKRGGRWGASRGNWKLASRRWVRLRPTDDGACTAYLIEARDFVAN